jgi:hypothetical protein
LADPEQKITPLDMKEQIYESAMVTVFHDSENDIAVVKWKQNCGNILEDKHKDQLSAMRTTLNELSPKNLLADLSACEYYIKPGTGSWYENPLFRIYTETPAKKIALVIPKNLFVNAFFDASRAQKIIDINTNLQYFADQEKAMEWLKSE